MLRKALAVLALAAAAVPALAGTRDFTGNVSFIQYVYNGNKMTQYTVGLRSFKPDGTVASFTNIAFLAASGTDIKSTRDLEHARTVFETAMNNFQRASFHVNTSDSKVCNLGTTGCDQFFSVTSNMGLAIGRIAD